MKLSFVDPLQRNKVTSKTITCFILDIYFSLNGNILRSSHSLADYFHQSDNSILTLKGKIPKVPQGLVLKQVHFNIFFGDTDQR